VERIIILLRVFLAETFLLGILASFVVGKGMRGI
jgi:hypothetical protein